MKKKGFCVLFVSIITNSVFSQTIETSIKSNTENIIVKKTVNVEKIRAEIQNCSNSSYIIVDSDTVLCGKLDLMTSLFSDSYVMVNNVIKVKLSEIIAIKNEDQYYAKVTSFWGNDYLAERYRTGNFDIYRLKNVYKLEGFIPIASIYNYYILDSTLIIKDASYSNCKPLFLENALSMKNLKIYEYMKIAKWSCWIGGIGLLGAGAFLTEGKKNLSSLLFIGPGIYLVGYIFHFKEPACLEEAIDSFFQYGDKRN